MMILRTFALFILLFCSTAYAQYPDGTLVFSSKKGLVGRVAKRITGGDQYTHVGVIIDGMVYESDFPKSKATPVHLYGKWRTTNDFYIPTHLYSDEQVTRMRANAQANLGKPYRLRNYINPRTPKTDGTWCSPYAGTVINQTGRFRLNSNDLYEPQNLLMKVSPYYRLHSRVVR